MMILDPAEIDTSQAGSNINCDSEIHRQGALASLHQVGSCKNVHFSRYVSCLDLKYLFSDDISCALIITCSGLIFYMAGYDDNACDIFEKITSYSINVCCH